MRWEKKVKVEPIVGDEKVLIVFAWIPTLCGNTWVWLEKYQQIQKYTWEATYHGSYPDWVIVRNELL